MKKITMKNKILILLSFVFILICSFTISSFAYHEDSNGNLVSDNLYSIGSYSSTQNGVSMSVSNQTLTLNGTSTDRFYDYRSELSISLEPGTYTMQWFTSYIGNDIGFGIFKPDSDFANLYILNTNRYRTFTISETTTFYTMIWWSRSNMTFDNVKVSCMVYSGNYKGNISFESYGSIYFKERIVSSLGLLNYTNIKYGYFEHANSFQYNNIYRSAFIYNGNYGHLYDKLDLFDWNDFELDSNNFIYNKIYSKYGSFYHTEWNVYSFITNYGSYSDNDNIPFTMNYEFIAPISFTDVAFSFNDFELVYFYDSNGFLLKTITPNDNQLLSLNDVSKIVCYNHINDIVGDSNFIITDLYAGSYDIGYSNGYNNALSYANPIIDEYKQAIDTYKDTIHILSDRISSLENSNRNYTNLIWTIGATPWESFKHIWNVEFGGINIANIITGLVTALLVIYLIKKIWK